MSSKDTVSFTIRPPPTSRPNLPNRSSRPASSASFAPAPPDSSDEDEQGDAIELLSGFDQSGPQRLNGVLKPSGGPLVIPPLANRDWRAIARQRRGGQVYTPDGLGVPVGEDGSQGGLGTRDSINSGPQVAGLVIHRKEETTETTAVETVEEVTLASASKTPAAAVELDEDERARQALLASVNGEANQESTIDVIPVSENNVSRPISETDAYRQDIVTRPDSASLEDYERVPISQFGAALLRGMGWKEGTAASRKGRGLVEPWLPASRPALLGLGAKERPAEETFSQPGKKGSRKADNNKRYIPVAKIQKEESLVVTGRTRTRSRSPDRSRTSSRYPSSEAADKNDPETREYRNRDRERDSRYYDRSDHKTHRSRTSIGSEMRKNDHDRYDRYSGESDRRREDNDGSGGRRRERKDHYNDGRRDSRDSRPRY